MGIAPTIVEEKDAPIFKLSNVEMLSIIRDHLSLPCPASPVKVAFIHALLIGIAETALAVHFSFFPGAFIENPEGKEFFFA